MEKHIKLTIAIFAHIAALLCFLLLVYTLFSFLVLSPPVAKAQTGSYLPSEYYTVTGTQVIIEKNIPGCVDGSYGSNIKTLWFSTDDGDTWASGGQSYTGCFSGQYFYDVSTTFPLVIQESSWFTGASPRLLHYVYEGVVPGNPNTVLVLPFSFDGTNFVPPEPPAPENAFLLIVEPEQGETTASTTVEVVAEYGIPEEWDFRFGRTAANITDIFIEYSYFFGSNRVTFTDDEIATTPGVHESTIEHIFPDTTGRPGITLSAVLRIEFDDGGFTDYAISEDVFFSVVASTDIDWGWDYGDEDTRDALARAECSITSIQGCFQNALVYLFAPDPQVLSNFSNMWQQIAMLPPMGYVTVTINALSDLNASGSGAFSFPELPFMNEIFTPLKTAIEGVLWVWIGAQFLHRVRDLDL